MAPRQALPAATGGCDGQEPCPPFDPLTVTTGALWVEEAGAWGISATSAPGATYTVELRQLASAPASAGEADALFDEATPGTPTTGSSFTSLIEAGPADAPAVGAQVVVTSEDGCEATLRFFFVGTVEAEATVKAVTNGDGSLVAGSFTEPSEGIGGVTEGVCPDAGSYLPVGPSQCGAAIPTTLSGLAVVECDTDEFPALDALFGFWTEEDGDAWEAGLFTAPEFPNPPQDYVLPDGVTVVTEYGLLESDDLSAIIWQPWPGGNSTTASIPIPLPADFDGVAFRFTLTAGGCTVVLSIAVIPTPEDASAAGSVVWVQQNDDEWDTVNVIPQGEGTGMGASALLESGDGFAAGAVCVTPDPVLAFGQPECVPPFRVTPELREATQVGALVVSEGSGEGPIVGATYVRVRRDDSDAGSTVTVLGSYALAIGETIEFHAPAGFFLADVLIEVTADGVASVAYVAP